jgi:hypothetical protein
MGVALSKLGQCPTHSGRTDEPLGASDSSVDIRSSSSAKVLFSFRLSLTFSRLVLPQAAVLLFCINCAAQEDVAGVEVSDLRAAYLATLENISSLEVHYTQEHTSTPGPVTRHWFRSAEKWRHVEDVSGRHVENVSGSDSAAFCHDGQYYYNLRLTDGRFTNVQVVDGFDPVFEMNILPDALLGVDVLSTPSSLADLLADPDATVVGHAAVGGVECWHIYGPAFRTHNQGATNRVRVFLDPQKDYLPRRIVLHTDGAEFGDSEIQGWFIDIHIEEFLQVPDERTGSLRWFPSRALILQSIPNQITMDIASVRVNPPLDDGLFRPVINARTEVLDLTADGGKLFIAGSPQEFDQHLQHLAESAEAMAVQRPKSSNWLLLIVANLVVAAIVAIWIWKRSLRSSTQQ